MTSRFLCKVQALVLFFCSTQTGFAGTEAPFTPTGGLNQTSPESIGANTCGLYAVFHCSHALLKTPLTHETFKQCVALWRYKYPHLRANNLEIDDINILLRETNLETRVGIINAEALFTNHPGESSQFLISCFKKHVKTGIRTFIVHTGNGIFSTQQALANHWYVLIVNPDGSYQKHIDSLPGDRTAHAHSVAQEIQKILGPNTRKNTFKAYF